MGDLEVKSFSGGGVDIKIIRYGFSQFDEREKSLQQNNQSINPVYNANCDNTALDGNPIVDVAKTFFDSPDPIDSGEIATDGENQ